MYRNIYPLFESMVKVFIRSFFIAFFLCWCGAFLLLYIRLFSDSALISCHSQHLLRLMILILLCVLISIILCSCFINSFAPYNSTKCQENLSKLVIINIFFSILLFFTFYWHSYNLSTLIHLAVLFHILVLA